MKALLFLPLILFVTACGDDEEIDYSPFYGKWIIDGACPTWVCENESDFVDVNWGYYIELIKPRKYIICDHIDLGECQTYSGRFQVRKGNGEGYNIEFYNTEGGFGTHSLFFLDNSTFVISFVEEDQILTYRYIKSSSL